MPCEFMIPYPVSANRYWRTRVIRSGAGQIVQTYPSPEGKAYKTAVQWCALKAGIRRPIVGFVGLDLVLRPPMPVDPDVRLSKQGPTWYLRLRSIDIDNALKVTLDALNGLAYEDDRQIVSVSVRKGAPIDGGGATIRVSALGVEDLASGAQRQLMPPDEPGNDR